MRVNESIERTDLAACRLRPRQDPHRHSPTTTSADDICDAACDALATNIAGIPVGRCVSRVPAVPGAYRHLLGLRLRVTLAGLALPAPRSHADSDRGEDRRRRHQPEHLHDHQGAGGAQEPGNGSSPTGAPDSWPSMQNVRMPDDTVGTFSISVEAGLYPDQVMKNAASELACDILNTIAQERTPADGIQSANVYGETVSYTCVSATRPISSR